MEYFQWIEIPDKNKTPPITSRYKNILWCINTALYKMYTLFHALLKFIIPLVKIPIEYECRSMQGQLWSYFLTLIRMTKDEKGLAFFKGLLL